MNTADFTASILALAAEHLDTRASITHPLGGHQVSRCVSIGAVKDAIAVASDTVLRSNRMVGCSRIDAARIKVYCTLPPVTGTVADYANALRALAA